MIYGHVEPGYVVVASKGGAPDQPRWFTNLVATPGVGVQVATERFDATVRVAGGTERKQLRASMAEIYPPYEDYQRKTTREIPVVVPERHPPG